MKGFLGGNFNTGDILNLVIDDNYTYVSGDYNSNIVLNKSTYTQKGTKIKLKYDGSKWNEVGCLDNSLMTKQIDLTSDNTISPSFGDNIDIVISATTINKIVMPTPNESVYKDYTLYVRNNSSTGDITYGGLDTTNLVANDSIKTTLGNGEMQVINIIKSPFISKWIIKSVSNSRVF